MGNSNSGRTGGHPTVEACGSYRLAIGTLRDMLNTPDRVVIVTRVYNAGTSERMALRIEVDTMHPDWPRVTFEHEGRARDGGIERYDVGVVWVRPPYGGKRWYFLCPRSGRRVGVLRLPRGGHRFWCREAYGLGYASQREDDLGRTQRRMMRLHARMGGDGRFDDLPPRKPKWTRWGTYERKAGVYDALAERADRLFYLGALRVLAGCDARARKRRASRKP